MGANTVPLIHLGQHVADYHWRPRLPTNLAPRPCLHPVRTLAGTEVTEFRPADHPHHLGVSVAVPDVAGTNFWGGRTFVTARGPVMLPNHGTQRHLAWHLHAPGEIVQSLHWCGANGESLLSEQRRIATVAAADWWALDFTFELTNITSLPLSFASPATHGRPGAGYGGFFWRAPRTDAPVRAFGPDDRRGEPGLHGKYAAWLALTGYAPGGAPWTLVFVPAPTARLSDRWFVRTRDYPGVGSALAWDRPMLLPAGGVLRRRIVTIVADGRLSVSAAGEAAAMVARDAAAAD